MTIEEIKSLMKSGDFAGAEAAAQELLTAEPNNVQAMILYGTCRQLQGDEATFRDTYKAVKEHLDATPDAQDAETKAAWERFDELYAKLDQPELLRKGDRPRSPVMMEYVVIAVLIAAAIVLGVLLFEGEIRQMISSHERVKPDYNNLYAADVRPELHKAATTARKFIDMSLKGYDK